MAQSLEAHEADVRRLKDRVVALELLLQQTMTRLASLENQVEGLLKAKKK
jgi:hypothetical protein